jgi:hypothetical protein
MILEVFNGGDQLLIHHLIDFIMISSTFYLKKSTKSPKTYIFVYVSKTVKRNVPKTIPPHCIFYALENNTT